MTHPALFNILIASALLPASAVLASTQLASTEDAHIQSTLSTPAYAVLDVAGNQLFAGCAGSVGKDRCSVIPVQLPDFGSVVDPFDTASFNFYYEGKQNGPIGNVDVYGLGRRSAPAVLVDDYWTATSTVDPTDATLLGENVITENSGVFGPRSVSNQTLVDYLNAQYAGGAGAGEYVFFRLSVDVAQVGGASRYLITSADGGTAATAPRLVYNESVTPPPGNRPFIWVQDSEKADILSKVAGQSWAQSLYNGIVSRVASDVAAHQSNRDSFIRNLPVIWTANPPISKTYPTYSEARLGSMYLFNTGVDCAVLYYLSGDEKYARCAADLLHNAVKAMVHVTPSTNLGNGGWIFQETSNGLLYEARVMGAQLPIIYDFLHAWLLNNQVYDVDSAGLEDFAFADAQEVFRTYYELTRDHGHLGSNWSSLMATTMLNCILALDDEAERDAALQVYLTTGSNRQASLDDEYSNYGNPGSVWPESLQYATAVGEIRSVHMAILERYDPALTLFDSYPNLPLSLPRIRDFIYPNETEQISFGDGKRRREGQSFFEYELIYRHANDQGYTQLASLMGSLINGGIAAGDYNRSSLKDYSTFDPKNAPLQLLWQEPTVTEAPVPHVLPRTDEVPHAGITLQRNHSPNGNPDYGLMGFVGGAAHIHSHASGMSMELYGMGQVMGAKAGRDDSYGTTIHEKYYRLFAANNTVIVNGASRGEGGWKSLAIDTVASVSMEPQPSAPAVSSNLSFTCSSFNDHRGTLAEATQQRTLALVRTSDTTGFYVDLFRSSSTVTNRAATTLNGNVTDQYHDYIYRNIGDLAMTIEAGGSALPLFSQTSRFQNDIGDTWEQPGWRYFSNTQVSYPQQSDLFAQFRATPSGQSSIYMDMHMPSIASREVAKTDSPAIKYAPAPYDNQDSPTLVIRQIGDAWDEPFLSVFEPHYGVSGGTIQSTTALWRAGTVVGVRVESIVGGNPVTHYVFSNPDDNQTYTDGSVGLSFQGRFGIIADFGAGDYELYLGDGRFIAYQGYSITSQVGDTEASMVVQPGQAPVVTANGPVDTTENPPAPPPAYGLIAGWDSWSSASAPATTVTAQGVTATATASAVGGTANWSNTDSGSDPGRGSSDDTTWGIFDGDGVPASSVTNAGVANLTATNAKTDAEVTFTITNNGAADIELGAFHFDALAFRPKAPRTYSLTVLAGSDITVGNVFTSGVPMNDNSTNAITHLGGGLSGHDQHDQIDLDLSGLADSTLESGGTAILQLEFTNGVGDGSGGHHLFLDNVAISGVTTPLTGIQNWRFLHFGTVDNSGVAADSFDANGDGESNLLEFATDQDPHANTSAATTLSLNGANLEFSYPRSKAAMADGMTFQVEWSETLLPGSWSSLGVSEVIDTEDSEVQNVTASFPAGYPGPRFVRLAVIR